MPNPTSSPDPAQKNRLLNLQTVEHTTPLLKDEHFAWFSEHVLGKARLELQGRALNTALSLEERDHACWQHAIVDKLCGELQRLHDSAERQLRQTDP